MDEQFWLGAAPAGSGTTAHFDATVLSIVDLCGLGADLVCTHIDHSGPIAATIMSARVSGPISPEKIAALVERCDGPVVEVSPGGELIAGEGDAAFRAALAARDGVGGRCVRFPGQAALTGAHSVAQITAESAIGEVIGVGAEIEIAPHSTVDTRGFLRPVFQDHQLVLHVEPAAGGVLRPIEIEHPHECCGGH